MLFDIARLRMAIRGLRALPPQLGSLAPFAATEPWRQPACLVECGQALQEPAAEPALASHTDGKELRLWNVAGGYCASLRIGGAPEPFVLQASADWSHVRTTCRAASAADGLALSDFIMISFIYSAARHDTVLLHASSVAVGGEAVVFTGPSGIGKSTHSRLWLSHVAGARLLNDDQPALRLIPGGVMVCGTPWSGKTPCYRNEQARLKAVFRMEQAGENKAVRLSRAEAFCALIDMTSLMRHDRASFALISQTVAGIASRIDAYTLRNRPDASAVALARALSGL